MDSVTLSPAVQSCADMSCTELGCAELGCEELRAAQLLMSGPPSDVSALCHVRTALLAIDPSRLPVRVHGTSYLSVYMTLGYR